MSADHALERVVIVDYGSQYTQLIARRVREHHVFCTITTPRVTLDELTRPDVKAVILSGGPSSVYGPDAPTLPGGFADLDVPVLFHPVPDGVDGPRRDERLARFDGDLWLGFLYEETLAVATLVLGVFPGLVSDLAQGASEALAGR